LEYFSETKWEKNLGQFYNGMALLDNRRSLNSRKTFKGLFKELDVKTLG
jgi:hypothetical protein